MTDKKHWREAKLIREGDETQTTEKGLEIPVPTRDEFEKAFGSKPVPSRSEKASRRTRRDPK